MFKKISLIVIFIIIMLIAFSGSVMSQVEHPQYVIVEKFENIEIRQYSKMVIASSEVEGSRAESISQGFKLVANYIFGENNQKEKISMTAPVMQQSKSSENDWTISFVMPSDYSFAKLPSPNDAKVKLTELSSKKMIAIRFSGSTNEENLQKHREILEEFIKNKEYKTRGNIIYAFYNPPWTLPFMKHNEIMSELE